jgi:hypothetical protein
MSAAARKRLAAAQKATLGRGPRWKGGASEDDHAQAEAVYARNAAPGGEPREGAQRRLRR